MTEARIVLVVAVSENGVIGRDGGMPWQLPSDLKRFKALTLGKPVIMGRRTFAAIGRALPGRPNIVITRNRAFGADGATVVSSLQEAVSLARQQAAALGVDEICIIGGGEIYRQSMAIADLLHVTQVSAVLSGDTTFPVIDASIFEKILDEPLPQTDKDSHAMHFTTWRRKASSA